MSTCKHESKQIQIQAEPNIIRYYLHTETLIYIDMKLYFLD